jgi:DNA-binding MarR family transcriptional regulator
MVVYKESPGTSTVDLGELDLGYLSLFLGLRFNELVIERLRSAGFPNAKQSHGYVVQHLIGQDRTITELAQRMEVTQQAASKVVAQMTRLGILEAAAAGDRRAKMIRLSERGRQSVKIARGARRIVESRLVKAVGAEDYESARKVLTKALNVLGGLQRIRTRKILEPR